MVHTGLLASILLSHTTIVAANLSFPWAASATSLLFLAASVALAYVLLGPFGLFYAFSALLQQLTMLSVAFILFPFLPLLAVILLVVPIYSFSHLLQVKRWKIKLPLTFGWGIVSLALFYVFSDVFLNITLHVFFGTLLIRRAVIYPTTEFAVKRAAQ